MSITDKLKKGASQFLFELGIEMKRDEIVAGFKTWMDQTPEDQWHKMIDSGAFPQLPAEYFAQAGQYLEYIEQLSLQDIIEFLAEARPDLVVYMNNCPTGGEYIRSLRSHFIKCIKDSVNGSAAIPEMATLACSQCNKTWPVKKSEVPNVKECPFCRSPAQ